MRSKPRKKRFWKAWPDSIFKCRFIIVMRAIAKQSRAASEELDCFVASAPRNDGDDDTPSTAVVPALRRDPQPLACVAKQGLGYIVQPRIRAVWVPACAGTTTEYTSAFSRRTAPEFCKFVHPQKERGRREDRVRAAPAVSCAKMHIAKCTRAYRFSGSSPAFPARWLYSLFRALPGETRACLSPSSRGYLRAT